MCPLLRTNCEMYAACLPFCCLALNACTIQQWLKHIKGGVITSCEESLWTYLLYNVDFVTSVYTSNLRGPCNESRNDIAMEMISLWKCFAGGCWAAVHRQLWHSNAAVLRQGFFVRQRVIGVSFQHLILV